MDVMLALLGVVGAFYFILLRPVMRQQRQRRSDISSLDVGDEVLTSGGFYATVQEIRTTDEGPTEIVLEIAPGVALRATPDAVQSIIQRAAVAEGDPAEGGSDGTDSP